MNAMKRTVMNLGKALEKADQDIRELEQMLLSRKRKGKAPSPKQGKSRSEVRGNDRPE